MSSKIWDFFLYFFSLYFHSFFSRFGEKKKIEKKISFGTRDRFNINYLTLRVDNVNPQLVILRSFFFK